MAVRSKLKLKIVFLSHDINTKLNEPGHEKMCLMSYANDKGTDQPAYPGSLISVFVVRCLDSISLDSLTEISRLQLASVAVQAGLCLAWSETPEDRFCHVVAQIIKSPISLFWPFSGLAQDDLQTLMFSTFESLFTYSIKLNYFERHCCSLLNKVTFPHITKSHMSHLMTKPTKWHVCPAKNQINLGILSV